jgi:hypothetical protein
VLAHGLLVSNAGAWIRALDFASGKTVWEYPDPAEIGQNLAVPRVLDLGGTPVVLTAAGGEAIRLADGKILGHITGEVSSKMDVAGPLVNGDTLYYLSGDWRDRDIVAARLSLGASGDALAVGELWRIKQKQVRGFSLWRTLACDGLLYHGGSILDGRTGQLTQGRLPAAQGGYCWSAGLIVGDAFLSLDHARGRFLFRDLKTHKVLGDNTLPANPPEARDELRARANAHGPEWKIFGAGLPFPWKDRLYIRGFDYVWCIGAP